MLKEKENGNKVKIEGILSEIDLDYGSFQKNGAPMKTIKGVIKIRVRLMVKDTMNDLEIPVHLFASEMTNAGKKNPAFESIERIKNEYVSIAASDEDRADRVRITNGSLKMNEYYVDGETLVSYPRIHASFVSKIKKEEMTPEASFTSIFVVGAIGPELDKEGVETGRYKVKGVLPQYGGKVDIFDFYAESEGVINAISSYWHEGDTVRANGRLNFSSKTETHTVEVDFGEPTVQTRTINVSDLVLVGGSASPLEGEFAYDTAEIQAAMTARSKELAEKKEESKNRSAARTQAQGNVAPSPGLGLNNLGF